MKKQFILNWLTLTLLAMFQVVPTEAQRIQQPLGRGVTSVVHGSENFISWRKLAQDPEQAKYNVYYRTSQAGSFTKLNAEPLEKTNLKLSKNLAKGTQVAVALVVDGIEQPMSDPFTIPSTEFRGIFADIRYDKAGSPVSTLTTATKYVWPVDLTGDGEYDFIVDRQHIIEGETDKIEGYTRDGKHLWSVEIGPNVDIDQGHSDLVIAYDMNCDGYGDVVIKSSDGTRFWDAEKKTWGKYLLGKEDTDGDGIVDYTKQNKRNPPQYITVIDGRTGAEMATVEMNYPSDACMSYTRDNKSIFMGDEYNTINGHMGIAYLDGIHPSVVMEYCVRTAADEKHHYFTSAWGFDFEGGKATSFREQWQFAFHKQKESLELFHHLRIADVDQDGKDEIFNGTMAVDNDGTLYMNSGIAHGDRFRLGDIDPDRPGTEIFAIQQNAADMLGQILYDARTGEPIKRWYLGSVGDVGRGECMDVLPEHKGYEMWSTMPNMYTAQGNVAIEGSYANEFPYPSEGIWWDGELDREYVFAPDSKYNIDIRKFSGSKGNRLYEIAKNSNYTLQCGYGMRAQFWGDIIGDWREEVVVRRLENGQDVGIVGITTDFATEVNNIYCLQQDPNYRMQCTNRGYYQTPIPSFYLGYEMPTPPLPPSMTSELVWSANGTTLGKGQGGFTDMSRAASYVYEDGKTILFGLDGAENIIVNETISPDTLLFMVPVEKVYKLQGNGSISVNKDFWKSGAGTTILQLPVLCKGQTIISEGILEINNTFSGNIDLRARGTISGNAILDGVLTLEGALNYEGGRLSPGTGADPFGNITLRNKLDIHVPLFYECNLQTNQEIKADVLMIEGDLIIDDNCLTINIISNEDHLSEGKYALISWSGNISADVQKIKIKGLSGLSYNLIIEEKTLYLKINGQRQAAQGVVWTGAKNNVWDYQTENFTLNGDPTTFVANDQILFEDECKVTDIQISDLMPTSGVTFNNAYSTYTLNGNGGLSGSGGLTKNNAGTLYLTSTLSNYTGVTKLNGGKVYVKEFADGGIASSLGAASKDAANMIWGKTHIVSQHISSATDHGITIIDTTTLEIPGSGVLALKGVITGNGTLRKIGTGQLTLSYANANSLTGGIIVEEGTLAQGSYTTVLGSVKGKLTFKQGKFIQFYTTSSSNSPAFNYTVNVPEENDNLEFVLSGRTKIQGKWIGKGNTTFNSTYVRGDISADFSAYEGSITSAGGNTLRLIQGLNMPLGKLIVNDNVGGYKAGSSNTAEYTHSIGSINGSGSVVNGTWNIGYDNTDFTFAGTFTCKAVNKYGIGTMSLTGSGSSAPITVYNGKLNISAAKSENKPTSGMISAAGKDAMIMGGGYVSAITINSGATLHLGTGTVAAKKMYVEKTLSINSSNIIIHRNSSNNDQLIVSGNCILTSPTIHLEITRGNPWASGDEIKIIDCSGNITLNGEVTIISDLAQGLEWDTSTLATDGTLRVKGNVGLDRIWRDENGNIIYYDLNGIRIDNPSDGEIYLFLGKKNIYHKN